MSRERMRMQLLQQLRLETETARRVAQRLGLEDSGDTVGLITLPTVTTQFLLTSGLLHPAKDRTLVTALLTYWSFSNDLQRSIFQGGGLDTFRQWMLKAASDIDANIPDRVKRRKR